MLCCLILHGRSIREVQRIAIRNVGGRCAISNHGPFAILAMVREFLGRAICFEEDLVAGGTRVRLIWRRHLRGPEGGSENPACPAAGTLASLSGAVPTCRGWLSLAVCGSGPSEY